MKYFFLFFLFIPSSNAQITAYNLFSKNTLHVNRQKIKILDTKLLYFDDKKGIPFCEISDLAYEKGFVYFISDQGFLYKFSITTTQNKINTLKYLDAFILKNKKQQRLKKKKRDAEGLALYKDNLLISFERKQRVDLYSKNAHKIKTIKIHQELENKHNYAGKNKGLEAVAFNENYGVVTAPELPLRNTDNRYHTLYSKNSKFKFMAEGSVVSLEFFDKKNILVLLRSFDYITQRRVTTLVKVTLENCTKSRVCKSRILARLDSTDGWRVDNFEGLTKIDKKRYLMVSDDNENIFQKTLLVLFEIKD